MKQLTHIQLGIMNTGGVLMLIALVAHLFVPEVAAYAFAIGACLFGSMQMLQRYEGRNVIIKRLRRMQVMGAILLILGGFAMVIPYCTPYYGHRNEWLVFLAIGTLLQTWTAFRIPGEHKKEG